MAGKYMPVTGGIGKATATGPAAMASPPVIRAAPRLPSTSFGAEDHAAHLGIIIRVARPLMKAPSQGPLTTVYLASSPEVEGGTGQYIAHRKPKASSKASYDTAAAARPWQTSAALTGPDRGRIAINSGTSTSDGPGAQAKRPVGDLRQLLPRPDEQSPDYNRLARRQNARSGAGHGWPCWRPGERSYRRVRARLSGAQQAVGRRGVSHAPCRRWLACEASSGDRLHPRLTHRACWLDRLGELHDRPSADGAGFIVGAAPGRCRARSDAVTGKSFRRGAGLSS
jgi:hypothetical protein